MTPHKPHHAFLVWWVIGAGAGTSVEAQLSLSGPGIDPSAFRVTTFASGLNFPVGMVQADDGSILVAVSNGNSFFNSSSGSILRLHDTNGDGVADQQQVLVDHVPGGALSTLRVAGDLLVTTGQRKPITIYRRGSLPSDPLTQVGSISINYPAGSWLHPHSALAVRPVAGHAGSYELFFQLGSKENFAVTTQTATLTSDLGLSGTLAGDALHRVTITDHGDRISASQLTQVATGLRNAAGMLLEPVTGDLYFQDNGIDGLVDPNEPHSADELNRLPAADIGGEIESFGFPDTYVAYRTGENVGSTGISPLVAFQPLPGPTGDEEAEGPNDLAWSPARFPEPLRHGIFVGMHGKFSQGGLANEENPLVFVDLRDNSYFHFIRNDEPDVGHLDGLLSTTDSLFVADLSPSGGLGSSGSFSGKIYQIQSLLLGGDFDLDGQYGCSDADSLAAAIAAGTHAAAFDLTGDGLVDGDDLAAWLAEAGAANLGPGRAYLPGDMNLDGFVDVSDFNVWNMHRFSSQPAWCVGDVNADGQIDVSDFNLWNNHRFRAAAQTVPEPPPWTGILIAGLFACGRMNRRRQPRPILTHRPACAGPLPCRWPGAPGRRHGNGKKF